MADVEVGDGEILYPSMDSEDSFPSEDVEDGTRLVIDLVLVYKYDADQEMAHTRKHFQDNLLSQGLKLQEEKGQDFEESQTMFVKVHAPVSVLARQADVLCLKKSVKQLINLKEPKKSNIVPAFFKANERNEPTCLKAAFREDISEVFLSDGEQLMDIFTAAERSEIVYDILLKTKYGIEDKHIGIRRMLNDGAYIAAYPLHEGSHIKITNSRCTSDRQKLYEEWAHPSMWYKTQPLDLVRKYFGDEVGIYFAWLGFYTKMLIPASIVGFICFIYGLASVGTNFNTPSQEICDTSPNKPGSFILCPSCLDGVCPYEVLGDSCVYSQLSYLFDNPATVAFAIFMSFWATMFLELWKRRQARLTSHWGLTEAEFDMETRPEFDAQVTTTRINKLTGKEEPFLTLWSRTLRFTATVSGIAFMISMVIIAFIAIIVYKIAVAAAFYTTGDEFLKDNSQILTTTTAAVINLIVILVLGIVYRKVAKFLTDLECPRTQSEYDDSFTFKIFVFEFLNCYSILLYIAFFKGKFYTYPGDDSMWKTFFGIGADQCDTAGCISELFIQLMIIMVGKQIFNNLTEIVIPFIKEWVGKKTVSKSKVDEPWERDFLLESVADSQSMFDEILEMVLQYGFLTLFVAAFPLAPLFALLNNLVEIRLDAYKFIVQHRRPIPKRMASLGAWFKILQSLTFLAVVSNAFVIAYTSEFIPRLVYMMTKSKDGTLEGYVSFTLSVFNTSDYDLGQSAPVPSCYYRGYRTPPSDDEPYSLTSDYWNVLAARLAFVVVFEHVVVAITGIIAYLIPDLPRDVKEKAYVEEKMLAERTQQFRLKKLHSNSSH